MQVQSEGHWDWSRLKAWLGRKLTRLAAAAEYQAAAQLELPTTAPPCGPSMCILKGSSPRMSVLRSPTRS
ncbi:unnamed protein product [Rangifer tarandus platyrhynchus]|uniref:Uncharacterized protein n=2 Tax=Rangifer tarandus platyrhynchus TaxID=3082113 RepID=A0ACB0ESH4_RANTA|nr:unnamed protein product [Rangifer tarandus platyrhynchus]CAI9703233.1 unnamed protein product [Rangifer tarandus platyrhynchus]